MLRTAESVSPKHPDKLCDQVSDAILDEALRQDPNSRVAIECLGGHGDLVIIGEMTTKAYINISEIGKRITGYTPLVKVIPQSSEIAQGVDTGGAGDQGIMVGYACNETPELMPLEVILARNLCKFIYKKFPYDGKTQITVEDGKVKSIVASFQNVKAKLLEELIEKWVMKDKLVKIGEDCKSFCNPAGDWNQGGFDADTGLTGRKIAVDSYGPRIPVGGGAFSGKDPSKVDRSAAYMARRVAVDLLKKSKAKEVYVYLAYAIGKAEPVQATAIIDGEQVKLHGIGFTPNGIINFLKLREPQFEETAKWGHFGNGFTWDK